MANSFVDRYRKYIPPDLATHDQWVLFKADKIPYSPRTEERASVSNPDSWADFKTALNKLAAHPGQFAGVGYVFVEGQDLVGIDLDHALLPGATEMKPWAKTLFQQMPPTYTEISQSGEGLHLIVKGHLPQSGRRRKLEDGGVELYQSGRYFALTAHPYPNSPNHIADAHLVLLSVYRDLFPEPTESAPTPIPAPTPEVAVFSEGDVLTRMLNSRNGPAIQALWAGDTSAHQGDDSAADLALLNHLAYWTQGDPHQMEALFSQSALGQRDKWRRRADYRERSIQRALASAAQPVFQRPVPPVRPIGQVTGVERPRLKAITGAELLQMEFPELRWVVPDLLPEGLTLLVGSPKAGKSFMAMDLCLAVATGGRVLNTGPVEVGDAVYLALEDNFRRLKDRLRQVMSESGLLPIRLHFLNEIPRADEGGLVAIEQWLDDYPETRLIVIDTLQKFRAQAAQASYASDYDAMAPIQRLALERQIGIILIHHVRKASASDPFDRISGTNALMGAADTSWVLDRQRGQADGNLHITGRDVEEKRLAVRFDEVTCTWQNLGEASEKPLTHEEREILAYLQPRGFVGPSQVARELGLSEDAAKQRLHRMAQRGKIVRNQRGRYAHPSYSPEKSDTEGVTSEPRTVIPFPAQGDTVTPLQGVPPIAPALGERHPVTSAPKPASDATQPGDTPAVTSSEPPTLA